MSDYQDYGDYQNKHRKLNFYDLHIACTSPAGHIHNPARRGEPIPRSNGGGSAGPKQIGGVGRSKWHRRMLAAGKQSQRPEKPGQSLLTLQLPAGPRYRVTEPDSRTIAALRRLRGAALPEKLESRRLAAVKASQPASRRVSQKKVKPAVVKRLALEAEVVAEMAAA